MLPNVLNWLFSHRAALLSHERQLIDSTLAAIMPKTRLTLQSQLQHLDFVQRHCDGKEVNLYYKSCVRDGGLMVPDMLLEWPIAVLRCFFQPSEPNVRASIWIASGRLFSIVFSRQVPRNAQNNIRVLRTEVLFDPFASHAAQLVQPRKANWQHWESLRRRCHDTPAPPLDERLRERFLVPSDGCLPIDFVELLNYTNSFEINNWRIMGLPLREVAMKSFNLFVLAESTDAKCLCARDGDAAKNTYLVNLEDQSQRKLSERFYDALDSLV
jgi:hypothetical protein